MNLSSQKKKDNTIVRYMRKICFCGFFIGYTSENFTTKVAHTFIEWFQKTNKTNNVTSANRNVLLYAKAVKWYRKTVNNVESDLFYFQGEKDRLKPPIFLTFDELKQSVRTTELYYLGESVARIELEMKQRKEMKNAV